MLNYNDLYELLRKEKYSESLQLLDKAFLNELGEYLRTLRENISQESDFLSGSSQGKKQLENSISLFKGLMLRRKKKLLQLVFVAAETGIMKRDYENMLEFEKKMFENLVKACEDGDKDLGKMLTGTKESENSKMIIFSEGVEQFVDMNGKIIGPFGKGDLVNLDSRVADILVSSGKANFVDE